VSTDTGGADLGGGGSADLLDETGVVGSAEADVVRKHRGAVDVVVAVYGVDPPQDRNLHAVHGW
jgi:hypothetical protein